LNGISNGISQSGWVPLAILLRPQGRRGELLAEPLSDLPNIFAADHELFLTPPHVTTPSPDSPSIRIEAHWFPTGKNAGRVVLKLSGCDSISDAEALAGKQLLLATDQLPTLDPDTFFVGDLVGCTLFNANHPIGTIVDVEFSTAPDGRTRLEDAAPLLAVQLTTNSAAAEPTLIPEVTVAPEPTLIPFVRAWLDNVDIPARRITMHLPEGLLTPIDPSQI
jgi:16S rRNA processing protein RimM